MRVQRIDSDMLEQIDQGALKAGKAFTVRGQEGREISRVELAEIAHDSFGFCTIVGDEIASVASVFGSGWRKGLLRASRNGARRGRTLRLHQGWGEEMSVWPARNLILSYGDGRRGTFTFIRGAVSSRVRDSVAGRERGLDAGPMKSACEGRRSTLHTSRRTSLLVLVLMVALAVAACTSDQPAAAPGPSPPLVSVTPPAEAVGTPQVESTPGGTTPPSAPGRSSL